MSKTHTIETTLIKSSRLASSSFGNPRWEFHTEAGTFRTMVNAACAYKGEPRNGEPITLVIVGSRKSVINYGWPQYPLG